MPSRRIIGVLILAVAYVALSRLTLSLTVLDGDLVAVWLPAGLALAALLREGLGLWPGLLVGAWIGNLLGVAGPLAALGEAAGATFGGVIAAVIIRHLVPSVRFNRLKDVTVLAGASVAGSVISALIGVSSLWLAGLHVWDSLVAGYLVWALGDISGMLLVAPLLLAATRARRLPSAARLAEAALTMVVLIAGAELLFRLDDAQLWPLMPVCVWIALRQGFHGAVAAGLGLAIVAVTATDAGRGPFADGTDFALVRAQAFAIVAAGMLLVVAAVTGERRKALHQYRAIAAEDAALRRVATAVAGPVPVDEACAMAAREAAALLGVDAALVVRFDGAARHCHPAEGAVLIGGDAPAAGADIVAAVRRTGGPVRLDDRESTRGRPRFAQRVATPVVAEGRTWGAMIVGTTATAELPPTVEQRLGRFADLVGSALAGAATKARLVAEASTDSLTGLLNHRALHECLREQTARAARSGLPVSLVMLDVDRFKALNDALGHETGDTVLRELADRARRAARPGHVLARVGGDELAVVLPDTGAGDARVVADRLRDAMTAEPFEGELVLTVSAGVADTTDTLDPAGLLALADGALYWAKSNGRDTTCVYDPAVVEELSDRERAERLERTKALGAVHALAQAIDAKDAATIRHSERVATLAARLAEASGWAPPDVTRLHDAGLVHDVGKIGIPDAILFKPGRLTPSEYEVVKRHSALGARIVSQVLDAQQVAWVRGHHERHDGCGYPDGLAGEEICAGARLMALADAWDAMTGARVYSDALPAAAALAEVERCEGSQFHADAVTALKVVLGQRAPLPPPVLALQDS